MYYLFHFFVELVFAGVGTYREHMESEGCYSILEINGLTVEYFDCYVLAYDQVTVWQDDERMLSLYRTSTGVWTELPRTADL
jgi:hypothetical protein